MKKHLILTILFSIITILTSFGQDSNLSNKENDSLFYNFDDVEILLEKEIKCKRKKTSKECAKKAVISYFNRNFDTNIIFESNLKKGKYTIDMWIIVDESGEVIKYDAASEVQVLADEAKKTLRLVPKIFIGQFQDRKVSTKLSFPALIQKTR